MQYSRSSHGEVINGSKIPLSPDLGTRYDSVILETLCCGKSTLFWLGPRCDPDVVSKIEIPVPDENATRS
jgi:hypothetical protein